VGGYVNYLLRTDPEFSGKSSKDSMPLQTETGAKAKKILEKAWANIVIAFCATLIVPLFLSTISSTLLSESRTDILKYFVFGGFCLLAAIFSKRFILSMEKQILGKAKEEAQDVAKSVAEAVASQLKKDTNIAITEVKAQVKEATKTALFSDKLKNWEKDFVAGKLSEKVFEEEFLPEIQDAIDLEPDPKKDTILLAEAIRFCYNTRKEYIINQLIDTYRQKIAIDYISWSDYAIGNMNLYHQNPFEKQYKLNILEGCDKALERVNDYGVSYIVKIFAHLMHKNQENNAEEKVKIDNEISGIFDKINDPAKQYSAYEAYTYVKRNETIDNSYLRPLITQMGNEFKEKFDTMINLYDEYKKKNNLPD
jgi:hypothetical protein